MDFTGSDRKLIVWLATEDTLDRQLVWNGNITHIPFELTSSPPHTMPKTPLEAATLILDQREDLIKSFLEDQPYDSRPHEIQPGDAFCMNEGKVYQFCCSWPDMTKPVLAGQIRVVADSTCQVPEWLDVI